MKRLISWLLALTLICGLLPLSAISAFAVETDVVDPAETTKPDFDEEFGDLIKPEIPELALGDNAIEIPAGNMNGVEYAFTAPTAGAYVLSFGLTSILQPEFDENNEPVIDEATGEQATFWEEVPGAYAASALRQYASVYVNEELVASSGLAGSAYELAAGDKLAIKIYSNMLNASYKMYINVASALVDGDNDVSLVAGPAGNTFKYVATQDGDLVIKPVAMSTYEYDMSSEEPVLTEVPAEYVENKFNRDFTVDMDATSVEAGQVVTIVITGMNAAAEVTLNVSIAEPAPEGSTINNPTWLDNTDTENLYTATVPAKSTYYFYCNGDYTVNVEGAAFEIIEGYILAITNDTDAEVVYNVTQVPPVGYDSNPEVITNMDGYSSTISLPEGGEYWYTYTASEAGTVTLSVTDGVNVTVNDETFKYDLEGNLVSEVVTIEVAEGDVLKIKINILENENWERPATTYTLTGAFEAAKPEVDLSQYMITFTNMDLSTEAEIQFRYHVQIPAEVLNDDDSYILLTKDGFAGEVEYKYTMKEIREEGKIVNGSYVLCAGIASPEMLRGITLEAFYNGDQNYHFCNTKGVDKGTSFTYSAVDYAHMALAGGTAAQKKLITNILTYGGYAQKFFNVDAENPAYNILSSYKISVPDIETVTADVYNQFKASASGTGATFSNFENVLDAAVYQRVDFTLNSGVNVKDCVFTLTGTDLNGTQFSIDLDPTLVSGNTYRVLVEDVPACYWDQTYTVTVTNTVTGDVYTATTSILAHCRTAIRAGSNANLVNLSKAMFLYNIAANEFYKK